MFFVYCGYRSPDNYDSESPNYVLSEYDTEEQVLQAKKEFDENVYDECVDVIFRVFEGKERNLRPISVVEKWTLT